MGFKINYEETDVTKGFGLIEPGEYEATIVTGEAKEWQGNYFIKFDVEIRSDVEQKFQGSKVMYSEFQVSPTLPEYEEKRKKKIATFMAACGQQSGKDLDDIAKDIVGKQVLVLVNHKEDKEGKKWPRVAFVAPSRAEKKNAQAGNEGAPSNNKGPIEVSEDDLPF